jgi:hypothetical protein
MFDSSSLGTAMMRPHLVTDRCVVAPAPDLKERLQAQFDRLRARAPELVRRNLTLETPTHVGLNPDPPMILWW